MNGVLGMDGGPNARGYGLAGGEGFDDVLDHLILCPHDFVNGAHTWTHKSPSSINNRTLNAPTVVDIYLEDPHPHYDWSVFFIDSMGTSLTLYDLYLTYAQARLAAGWGHVFIGSARPDDNDLVQALADAFNASLRAAVPDYPNVHFIDMSADPYIGVYGAQTDQPTYWGGSTYVSALGGILTAQYIYAAIRNYVEDFHSPFGPVNTLGRELVA